MACFSQFCVNSSKVLRVGVTALLMLALLAFVPQQVAIHVVDTGDVSENSPCQVDLVHVSKLLGIRLAAATDDQTTRAWTVEIRRHTAMAWLVRLHRPDGQLAAQQSVHGPLSDCKGVTELTSILLAAHLPELSLAARQRARPPSPTVPPNTAIQKSAAPLRRHPLAYHLFAGAGAAGFSAESIAWLVSVQVGAITWRHLYVGAEVITGHHRHRLFATEPGNVGAWRFSGRANLGYADRVAPITFPPITWTAGLSVGAQFTNGYAVSLPQTRSAIAGALELGLMTKTWMTLPKTLDGLAIGIGANALWTLPRATFEVTGFGAAYRHPAPELSLLLLVGWARL